MPSAISSSHQPAAIKSLGLPQGTVNNNLGPEHLECPKTLDPNYFRKPTLCLDVLTIHGAELRLFEAKAIPPTHTINVAHLT